MNPLYVRESGTFREATSLELLHHAQSLITRRLRPGTPVLDCPEDLRTYLRMHLGGLEHEIFAVLFLDSRHRLIEFVPLFRGTLKGSYVHPREVAKEVLARNAAAVILVHNHPSGISEASAADEQITQRLKDALALIEVRVLDHLIVADPIFSFAEHGLL